ncbi:M48 family metalloprotease [Pacificimonas sp. WHA3]|uniref:M48 family metalloprotease n=1 Tax=Pacificimonas pallii TaxID=2827236 RepID=A0ABS6SAI0_9SPHN|nr:M48 family metalloprotease [Pacificimonas pallii]MBV7255403.1 M48 family metalloprotease [Pacificimonas pallii]
MIAVRHLTLMLFALLLAARPAHAQSVLRDAETEAWMDRLAAPIAEAAGLNPKNVDMVLINNPSLNAFVVSGQTIYMHSGTLLQADDANQIQGIVAHEMGHIAAGHAVRFGPEGGKRATGISILSLLAAGAAIAAGAGEAGAALLGLGQRASLGTLLSFNRQQESRTDQAGARYLEAAGISGKGSIGFFKKIQNQEFRLAIPQDNEYVRTHPLSGNRIAALEALYRQSPYWDTPTDPQLQADFERIQAKLYGFVESPEYTLRKFPESDTSAPARVARAYAFHKSAFPDRSAAEADALLAEDPNDPFILELKGQVLLESGRPAEAIEPLERAVALAPDQPLIATLLGHALLATEDEDMVARAAEVLKEAVRLDNQNPFGWYQLGIAYTQLGDEPRAALASAEQFAMTRQPQLAVANARTAMAGLDEGTPDWLRAQDVLLVATQDLEKNGKR